MRLLETIHILDGEALNLDYHQERIDRSRSQLGFKDKLELELSPPKNGEHRCRVLYEKEIEKVEYLSYKRKEISSFKLVHSDIIYDLKYEDREEINALLEKHPEADDIIIIKDGLVTDTSIANLSFFDGTHWLTPRRPLLHGTCRQRLLEAGKIVTADIDHRSLKDFSKIAVMNAMTDFHIIENAIIL
jgi:4-amino-4-deoxychorismate lyase